MLHYYLCMVPYSIFVMANTYIQLYAFCPTPSRNYHSGTPIPTYVDWDSHGQPKFRIGRGGGVRTHSLGRLQNTNHFGPFIK